MSTHAIILAAGKGTRMNSEKPKVLHEVKGGVLIDRVIKSLSKVSPCPTIIIGHKWEEIIKHTKNRYHYVWQKEQLGTGHAVLCARESLTGSSVGRCEPSLARLEARTSSYPSENPPSPPLGKGGSLESSSNPLRGRGVAKGGEIDNIIVVYGDHPFISSDTIEKLKKSHIDKKAKITISTISVPNFDEIRYYSIPTPQSREDCGGALNYSVFYGCGRVIRDENKNIKNIVELKDASDEEKNIKELNVGYYCFDADWLWKNIEKIDNNNKAQEYNLTDIVKIAIEQNILINSISIKNPIEAIGINNLEQLESARKIII